MTRYYFTFKSDEDAGAGSPNIISVEDPTPDAATFGAALAGLIKGDLTTISHPVGATHYAVSYPDIGGKDWARIVMRDAAGAVSTQWLFGVESVDLLRTGFQGLINGGTLLHPDSGAPVTSAVITASPQSKYVS